MRAAVVGMVLLCGIAQGAEPPDAERPLGKDRKAAVVAQAKQQVVELEKQRVAAVKVRNGDLVFKLVNDITLAKIQLKEALKKTAEDHAREADAEAKEAARKADAEAKEAARKADAVANMERVNDQFGAAFKTVTNTIGMELIGIPAGKFTMGYGVGVAVTLTKPFLMGATEVTQGQFKKVMGTEPWTRTVSFGGDTFTDGKPCVQIGEDNAATYVSWDDATAFCQKLTKREQNSASRYKLKVGEVYRLPTEAEWEYACRAGTKTTYSFGDDEKQLGNFGWFVGNYAGEDYAHKVGLKKPNPWGLHDMHGNVGEWCSDYYDEKLSGGTDPTGPEGGLYRVNRFGAWATIPGHCQSAHRFFIVSSFGDCTLGFRVARSQSAQ